MNEHQLENKAKKQKDAYILYKKGLTIRQISLVVGQSVGWTHSAIKDVKERNNPPVDKTLNKNEQDDKL